MSAKPVAVVRAIRAGASAVPARQAALLAMVAGTVLVMSLAGCSGSSASQPAETASGRASPSVPTQPGSAGSASSPSIPGDGKKMSEFGISHGPRESFSVPAGAVITARSDQATLVELAVSSPKPERMNRYLMRALPAAGFTITKQASSASTPAISFSGHGWNGKFTGHGATSGITLRPAG